MAKSQSSAAASQQARCPLQCQFSCRIVTIDSYAAPPIKNLDVCYSEFRSSAVDKVPVIRIFGSTPSGQKTCLHVHGVFPYLYVPCVNGASTDSYLQQLTRSIDHALQVSLGASSKPANHIFKIVVVKGIPFYGYHDTEELFLKIYLYNPGHIKRLADLLVAGAVMNQILQPHESHIPFPLQFMIDYNLYGMNFIHLSAVKFRLGGKENSLSSQSSQPRPSRRLSSPLSPLSPPTHFSFASSPSQTHWNVNTLPRDMVVCIPKESVCELETDALAADIVNRHELSMVSGGYPGLAAIWAEERQRRTMLNIDLPLTPPLSPDRCSQLYHPAEERLRAEFAEIVRERLGLSDDTVEVPTPSGDDIGYSQSCDLDVNQPTSLEDHVEMQDAIAKQPADESVIVNEDIVQESMELSQRLSAETIKKSTDAELLELMMALCQTQPSHTPLSQSLSSKYQREGETMESKAQRTHSIVSEKSLFGSPPASPVGGQTAEGMLDTSMSSVSDEDLFSSQDPEPCGDKSDVGKEQQAAVGIGLVDHMTGEKEMISSHLSIHSPNNTAHNGHSVTSMLVYREEKSDRHDSESEEADDTISGLHVSIRLPIAAHYGHSGKVHVPQSSTRDKLDAENGQQFEADFDLSMSSRLTSPIPPSPRSTELQRLDFKELDSFNSSDREIDSLEISESLPCAQPQHSRSPSMDPQAQADLHQVWNLTPAVAKESPFKLKPSSATGPQSTVQLEYEMPELSMSEFDTSADPIISALESSRSPTPLLKDTCNNMSGPLQETTSLPVISLPSLSSSSTHSVANSRRLLLRALSNAAAAAAGGGGEGGDGRMVEGEAGESEESDEDDSVWMSQETWDITNPDSVDPSSITASAQPQPVVSEEEEVKRLKKRKFSPIPQLDGSGDVPSPGGQKTKTKRKRKTLGFSRRKPRNLTSTIKKPGTSHSSDGSCAVTELREGTLHSDGSGSHVAAVASSNEQNETTSCSVSKSRRSLSLGKPSKRFRRTVESTEQPESQSTPTLNLNASELTSTLKKEALSCRFIPCLKKLPSSSFRIKKDPTLSSDHKVTPLCKNLESQTFGRRTTERESSSKTPSGRQQKSRRTSSSPKQQGSRRLTASETKKLRQERYESRLRSKQLRSPGSPQWMDNLKDFSYVQQLKMALEESQKSQEDTSTKQSSITNRPQESGSECEQSLAQTIPISLQSKHSTQALNSKHSITQTTTQQEAMSEDVSSDINPPTSPQLLSPVSMTSSRDLDTTVIDESPLCSDSDEVRMEIDVSNQQQDPVSDLAVSVKSEGGAESESCEVELPEQSKRVDNAISMSEEETSAHGDVDPPDGLLDTSISSICESPPFTSSQKDQVTKNKEDHFHFDTSFDSELEAAMQVSNTNTPPESPIALPTLYTCSPSPVLEEEELLQPKDSPSESEVSTSSSSTAWDFHLALSNEEDEVVSEGYSPEACPQSSEIKTTETVTFSASVGPSSYVHLKDEFAEEARGSDVVTVVRPLISPPSVPELLSSATSYGICSAHHTKAFYSNPADVQPPLEVGGRILRVPSRMPYELHDFQPAYSKSGSDNSSQFSTTGLQQMRTIVSMLSSSIPGTQPTLPPLCHPPLETNRAHMAPYTAEDHKRDIELKSKFCTSRNTVITPAKPPPHPSKLVKRIEKSKLSSNQEKCVKEKAAFENKKEDEQKRQEQGLTEQLVTQQDQKMDADARSVEAEVKECDATTHSYLSSTPSGEEKAGVRSSHSPSEVKSPRSIRSNSSSCAIDDSLTSYQVPNQTHSTPVKCEGGEDREGGDSGDSGEVGDAIINGSSESSRSCTPVRKKNSEDMARPRFPLTPIMPPVLRKDTSQLEGPTPNNTYGFKVSQSALPGSCDIHEVQYLTCMSVEVHTRTRGSLRPDPDFDPVLALFYYIHNDWPSPSPSEENSRLGVLAIDVDNSGLKDTGKNSPPSLASVTQQKYLTGSGILDSVEVVYVESEEKLFEKLVELVHETDPDFLIGYEVTMLSWGYLIERAAALNINLANELSRMPKLQVEKKTLGSNNSRSEVTARWTSGVNVLGRIVLNVWNLLKHELALNIYTFENVAFHVLHQRAPLYSFESLTGWYDHSTSLYRHRVVEHYLRRCHGNFDLLEKFNLIGRTSEFARLYGIEFESVTGRGTQYRVESMMLRLAKPANYIALSPSVQQRARMAAPECLPLILEPESKFYSDPVLVLDFQSLYPSMVIGYNYCFSTCLGRVRGLAQNGDFTFGTYSLNVPNHVLKKLKDHIHISPNGVVYVKHHIRKGVMTTMLEEILGTRIMVKGSMKQHKANKALERMLNARQLGLKLIANVTYGYTAANFSGRMPCVEIADSIVRKGRETLERAIQLVNSTAEWRARVVYGDTDSLFVLLKGASKEEAFRVGREIVDRVTAENPKPIKLKFEKVYLPCILQTKKRYVGYMYESLDQAEPVFDAKGIETVRRDGCPAVGKVLEKSLHLLFTSKDLSLVKSYVQRQCSKLLDGRVNIQDYTFAKEYRGRQFYRPGACVPALELTKSSLAVDRRSEPRVGERVPYVIVYGTPGQPLIQLVRRPGELLENPGLRLNGVYYITKQILPALDRCFSLMGVDVRQWYTEMPRVFRAPVQVSDSSKKPKGTLGQYFATIHCPVCEELTTEGVCVRCSKNPQKVALSLSLRIREAEKAYGDIEELCQDCVGSRDSTHHHSKCISLDCPILYRKHRAKQELASSESLRLLLQNFVRTKVT